MLGIGRLAIIGKSVFQSRYDQIVEQRMVQRRLGGRGDEPIGANHIQRFIIVGQAKDIGFQPIESAWLSSRFL